MLAGTVVDMVLVAVAGATVDATKGVAAAVVGTVATVVGMAAVAGGPEAAATTVSGGGAASPVVLERSRLSGDPPSAAG
jgi:hypothetical protein